jgi:hypothetical protein
MSNPKQNATVSRSYQPEVDSCIRAVVLLLKTSARKQATEHTPEPDGPNDGTKVKEDSADAPIIREPS